MSSENQKQSASQRFIIIDRNFGSAKITSKQANIIRPGRYELFADFQKGMRAIHEKPTTAAFIDMQIDNGGSGLAMLAQLRRDPQFIHLPVILTSPTIGVNDLTAIHGYGCCAAVAKPIHQKDLREALQKVFNESSWYNMNSPRIDQVLKVSEIDANLANAAIKSMLQESPNPVTLALSLGSVMGQNRSSFSHADAVYDMILSKYPRHIPTINAKAKLYSVQGRHQQAKRLLENAFQLAPKSLEQLSLLGDIEISLKNPEGAIESFHRALGIDENHSKSRIGLTVAEGCSRFATQQARDNTFEPSIAKIINNLGVSLAQKGQFEKALKYYLMSLSFLGTEGLQARVSFNMGLGFKKWQKLPQAKYWLEECLRLSDGPTDKAQYHLRTLALVLGEIGSTVPMQIAKPTGAVSAPAKIFEEESVSLNVGRPKKIQGINSIDERLLDELEGNLDRMNLNVTFDEAI